MTERQFSWGLSNGVIALSIAGTFWLGYGIGSARTSVLQVFRQPTVRNQAGSVYWDRYDFAKHPFILYFRNDTVESIQLVYK
jgi:hypothetical protein